MRAVSLIRQQAFLNAPPEVVWDLVGDVTRHPEWWPKVVSVECEGLEEGCVYREIVEMPFGSPGEMRLLIDGLDDGRRFSIRCLNTGMFMRATLTPAQGGTFVDGEMGMEPSGKGLSNRAFDLVAGRRYFKTWLADTMASLRTAAEERSREGVGDPGFEPGTSSLSEMRSNRLS
jgi:hypothetical protein